MTESNTETLIRVDLDLRKSKDIRLPFYNPDDRIFVFWWVGICSRQEASTGEGLADEAIQS